MYEENVAEGMVCLKRFDLQSKIDSYFSADTRETAID